MEICGHCHFLMRDDAAECGVCHRPRVVVMNDGVTVVDDVRVGSGRSTGLPVALVVLLVLVVAVGSGVAATALHWF